jgi:hypothetical protein
MTMEKPENFTGAKMFRVDLFFDTHFFESNKLTPEYVLRIFRERGLLSKGVRAFVSEPKSAFIVGKNICPNDGSPEVTSRALDEDETACPICGHVTYVEPKGVQT